MSDIRYTIAVCQLNMVETVEESVESLLASSDDRFEVLVIDDGSTDGGREILGRLAEDHERVRVRDGDNASIAEARNDSIRHARGDIVLHQLDADDRYDGDLTDFVTVFERLEECFERPVYLRGRNVHLARRDLLLDHPYRPVGYGEDLDLWRRLTAAEDVEMVWLAHHEINHQIGYERSLLEYAGVRYSTVRVQFRTGIRPLSYVRCMIADLLPGGLDTRPWYGSVFHILVTLPAWLQARGNRLASNHELPPAYRDYCWYRRTVIDRVTSVPELITRHGLRLSREELTNPGLFFDDLPDPETVAP